MLNTEQDIQDALAYLNPDNREEWVKAGMAIKAEVGESGYSIWNEWGQGSATHKERDAQSVWKSFKKNGVGIGTLFGMAMDRGWKRPRDTPKTARGDPEQKAAWIWDHAKPAPNDHPYLVRKRVKSHGLRLHKESLTIPLRNVRGDLKTLQFILPNPNDDGKDKLLLKDGEKQGAFFVIGSLSRARVALLCEGYATGASLHEHTGLPVAVCIDAGNLEPVALAIRGAYPRLRMLICGDHDAFKAGGNTGQEKAKAAAYALTGGANWCVPDFITPCDAEVLEEAGIDPSKSQRKAALASLRQRDSQRYEVEKPTDFNDLANWIGGADRVKAQIEAAIGRIGLIEVRSGDMPRVVRQAEAELIFGGGVYQRSGNLVRVVRHDFQAGKDSMDGLPLGALRLCEITAHWLTERFATVSSWKRWKEREQAWKSIDPPIQYAATYLSKVGQWRAPVLTGIIECPTLRRDGTLLSKSGYDPPSGLYVDYAGPPLHVPDSPTRADALAALETLKTPYSEFQFADPATGISIALAATLTAVVRRSLRTAPLFAFDAPVMGSGKGLLVKIAALIATGRPAPLLSQGKDEAEDEKRLGSLLLAGVSMMNLDNIERPVGGQLLNSMLTEPVCNPRILGKSESPEMPCNLTLFATGNNLQFLGDMVRRVLICRIDPGCERPDARTFSRNLNDWVPEHRQELLGAALVILRAYIVAGKPAQPIQPYGSFEEWSGLIRSALVWLGEADPCLSRAALEEDDPVTASLHSILPLWHDSIGERVVTTNEVCGIARDDLLLALLEIAGSRRDPDKVDAKRLGKWLAKHKGRISSGLRIVRGEDEHRKTALWRVVRVNLSAGNAGNAGSVLYPTQGIGSCKNDSVKIILPNGYKELKSTPHSPQTPQDIADDWCPE